MECTGKVKWFRNDYGYGFIIDDNAVASEADVFVHYSDIQQSGYASLDKNDEVKYKLVHTPKGPKAEDVRKV